MEFVILNGKTPANKFKEKGLTWDEVKDFDNIGLIVPKGYIVLDFDTEDDAEIMLKIVEELDLKCRVIQTSRGIHCYFKKGQLDKCFTKARLAVGIYSDGKSGEKRSYVKIKQDGKMRKRLKAMSLKDVQEVPRWLYPVDAGERFNFKGMKDGDGRNQELFNYIVYLQSKGFKKAEIKEAIKVINQFVFAKPLPDFEINTLLRDEAFRPDEEIEAQIQAQENKGKGFKHNKFGDDLINTFNIITVNGQLYVYDDGYYQQDERVIERKMIELYPSIKQRDRQEVLAYIRIKTHMTRDQLKINYYTLNLKNTRLDIRNKQQMDFTPEAIEFQRIPVVYDEDAYCEAVDKMLRRVFLDDEELLKLFDEMLGACLIKHNRYQKAFMLWGSGSNGKSTVLDMIKHFLGRGNYVSIDLDQLTSNKFSTAELENMLANIGDDVNDIMMKETGTLKKLFSGNALQVQRKNERPFTLEPYALHIFSCNVLPRSLDKSDGFYRRWIFVPFNARFSSTDPDYDPLIEDKVMTDEAMSYLLNRAIAGAQRLMRNNHFTEPKLVTELLDTYMSENSTTLSWVIDNNYDVDYLLEKPTDELYSEFTDWCKNSGIKTANVTGKKTFYKELIIKYGFEGKPKQRGNGKRYFNMTLE